MCYYNTSRKGQSYPCLSQYSTGSSACQPLSEKIMKLIHRKLYHIFMQIARCIYIKYKILIQHIKADNPSDNAIHKSLLLCNPPKLHNTPSHRLKNSFEFVGTYEGGIFLPFVAADFFGGVMPIRAEQEK